jgi:hypothetical protein
VYQLELFGVNSLYFKPIAKVLQTVQAHQDLKGNVLHPVHWGTFNLALHPWYEPWCAYQPQQTRKTSGSQHLLSEKPLYTEAIYAQQDGGKK